MSEMVKYHLWLNKLKDQDSEPFSKNGEEIVKNAIIKIIFSDYFTDYIFRKISTQFTCDIKTCCLAYDNESDSFKLVFNPLFIYYMNEVNQYFVYFFIFHELYHFLLEHLTARVDNKKTEAWNIATDLSINSLLKKDFKKRGWKIPPFGMFPGVGKFSKLEELKSAEYYYGIIEKDYEENELCELFTIDSHESWNSKYLKSDRIGEIAKQIIYGASEEFSKIEHGSSFINESLLKSIKNAGVDEIDPERIFRFFIYRSISSNRKTSIFKINKRFPYLYPGTKKEKKAKIAISIDQSASISDDMLVLFFEIAKKFLTLTEFDIIPFDSDIYLDKIVNLNKYTPNLDLKRGLRGGTNFTPAIKYVNKNYEYDGHIIMSDMEAHKSKENSRCPLIWIVPKNSTPYFNTEKETIIFF